MAFAHSATTARPFAAGSPAPGRVLVKEVNWLGDLVMSLPALRAVRRAFPDAHLGVLVKRELAGFFDGASDWIDEVIPYALSGGVRGLADRGRIIGEIRSRRFDLAVLFPNSFESALWVRLAGVARRAGFATDARARLLTDKSVPPRQALSGHQVHYWLSMLRATLGVAGDPGDYAVTPSAATRARMREWLAARRRRADRPLIALSPAAAFGPAKEWPAAKYAELIANLARRFGAECVMIGAPAERARCLQVLRLSGEEPLIAAGETGVGELIALLSLCQGFAGNDSGAMHLAGALGIPTVAVFGSTNPARTGPLGPKTRVLYEALECSPCLARHCRFGHYNCLYAIEPPRVVRALEELGALG